MSKNILIVDDEFPVREILTRIIESLRFACDTGNHGQEGYELFLENKYDLIITDMNMPIMDGKTMINKIRSSEIFSNIPIIILSGFVSVKDVKELLEEGATYFLKKPIEVEEIIEYIHKSLNLPNTKE